MCLRGNIKSLMQYVVNFLRAQEKENILRRLAHSNAINLTNILSYIFLSHTLVDHNSFWCQQAHSHIVKWFIHVAEEAASIPGQLTVMYVPNKLAQPQLQVVSSYQIKWGHWTCENRPLCDFFFFFFFWSILINTGSYNPKLLHKKFHAPLMCRQHRVRLLSNCAHLQ